jgi:hypothetical protein
MHVAAEQDGTVEGKAWKCLDPICRVHQHRPPRLVYSAYDAQHYSSLTAGA